VRRVHAAAAWGSGDLMHQRAVSARRGVLLCATALAGSVSLALVGTSSAEAATFAVSNTSDSGIGMDELHQLIQALRADRTRPSWPSKVDVTKSAESDNTYGNPVAPYIRPGGASIPIATPKEVSRWVNTVPETTVRSEKTTSDTARRFHEQWLAAERSPMAKLGFKPGSHIQTPAGTGGVNMPFLGSVGGLYNPNNDRSWSHEKYPDYAVHESIHRALYDLRRAERLPPGLPRDEDIVRALMNKNYKIPNTRLPRGANVPREQLDYLEALAAQRIAEKHPGGPR
jgi:hypothetical protein